MIRFTDVSKSYGATLVVERLCLEVSAGEVLALVGGSGSGKTTTLRMINRLTEPSSGRVEVGGRDVMTFAAHELRRRVGYVFQRIGLFSHMTLAENIGITPRLLGWAPERIQRRVDELLTQVELPPDSYRVRLPHQLSGGQQQRVGVARALAAEPTVLLCDEPFGALDPLTRSRLQEFFRVLQRRLRFTAIFVTHDVTEALLLADRIAVLHQGAIAQQGTPAELLRAPVNDYVAELIATPRKQAEMVSALLGEVMPT